MPVIRHAVTRREALLQLAAIAALPLPRISWPALLAADALDGTIAAYQAGRLRGDWSAVEVTTGALERCRTDGARWKAIDALAADAALAQARASDERLRRKALVGPMDGVPVFAKAIYDVKGLPTTGSNSEWAALFPEPVQRDAIEVARLRAAGAVILGKTAADDFAYHGNGTSTHTGQVLNPRDRTGTRIPGGSSAGSAVAVACGMAFAALGTDDGGSNRIPAQFTGCVGMKPTFGLVPRTGVIPTWPYLDTHGPLARSVADAALLLAVIAGADTSDPFAILGKPSWPAMRDALNGIRIGVVEDHVPRAQMSPEAIAIWERAVTDLKATGARVDTFTPPVNRLTFRAAFADAAKARGDVPVNPDSPAPTANALYRYFEGRTNDPKSALKRGYEAYQHYYDVLPKTYEECEPLFTKPMMDDPAGVSFAHSRAEVVASLAKAMRAADVHVMVYPTMPYDAPKIGEKWPDVRTPLIFGNWLGLPEVSVPAGLSADDMEALNVSFVGLPGTDAAILAYAHAYERQSRRFVLAGRR